MDVSTLARLLSDDANLWPVGDDTAILSTYFGWWFGRLASLHNAPQDSIPRLVVEAIEDLASGETPEVSEYRQKYLIARQSSRIPAITDISKTGGNRMLLVEQVKEIFLKATSMPGLVAEIVGYMMAQDAVLLLHVQKFAKSVWRNGLHSILSRYTNLTTEITAYGVLLKLRCTKGLIFLEMRSESMRDEEAVTFVAQNKDTLGIGLAIQYCTMPLFAAIQLLQVLIDAWPDDEAEQLELLGL